MATRRRAQTTFPSETYEARAARGMPTVSLVLPVETNEKLSQIAAEDGASRSATVARLVEAEAKRRARRKK